MSHQRTVTLYATQYRRIVLRPPVAGGAAVFNATRARATGEALVAVADHEDSLARVVGEPTSHPPLLVSAHA
jgi:hypothetical protein